jgi:predicted nucleotidyltransferase
MDQIKKLCHRYSVKSLYLFGSAATEDQFTNDSDIDFLVALKPEDQENCASNFFRLEYDLSQFFKRHVDLVMEESLSNPYFIKSVNQNKILLYEA